METTITGQVHYNPNGIIFHIYFAYFTSKIRDLMLFMCLPVNTGRPVFSGQLVARYHGLSRPLTTGCISVVAPTCLLVLFKDFAIDYCHTFCD